MVRNEFTYLINSYWYLLYDHSWSVARYQGTTTSTMIMRGGEI